MLLKCTADGRPIKVNGAPVNHGNGARGMKMTMSTAPTMSARIHRKVMRAPHKRAHPGKMAHPGKLGHPGKFAHLGKFGKLAHYSLTHSLRPPEPCESSNDSGLGPDAASRLSDTLESEWEHPERKRQRRESEMAVKLECDDANDAYPFPPPGCAPAPPAAPPDALAAPASLVPAPLPPPVPVPVIRAGCSLSSPNIAESTGKRFQDPYAIRSCGKLGSGGKLANKYASGGKLGAGGKVGGKLAGKYGGKLAIARKRALMSQNSRPGLAAPLTGRSRDGTVELQILCQPETQHRARYQTEGSRGAVKDNSGNGFPIVKLVGYDKPAVLQVYIGTDAGRVQPHMFYQACRVAGKNSTPCKERKDDGTVVIEIDLEPSKNWQVTCDCVGILKERNVDVEHRFGESLIGTGATAGVAHVSRGKKKSTRCRMVFRTDIINKAGEQETLQVCSTQIICTQPPGVPEVCRKSLVSCPATGGLELYLLGKNFLKETRVVFAQRREGNTTWEEEVVPDKEFLQQTHLVCCVPPYWRADITEPVCVQVFVRSGGKASEPHAFYYTPVSRHAGPLHATQHHAQGAVSEDARPVLMWAGAGGGMMPPPTLPVRRPSIIVPDPHSPLGLKSEVTDDSSQHSLAEHEACGDGGERSPRALLQDDLGVDLRLKAETPAAQVGFVSGYEAMKLSPPTPENERPSPLASFAQQLQAIQNQVQTDKMVETVTAAIFNTEAAPQMYPGMLGGMQPLDPMRQLLPPKEQLEADMKVLNPELMVAGGAAVLQPERLFSRPPGDAFNPFGAITKMEMETTQMREQRLAQQSAHMEALVEDAMKATAAMLPADAAKLDELVNSRVEDHLSGGSSASPSSASHASDVILSPNAVVGLGGGAGGGGQELVPGMAASAMSPDVILNTQVSPSMLCEAGAHQRIVLPPAAQDELMLLPEQVQLTSVKTPPAAVKSMILNAAAEILTSDSTMNALVTSAINTANILTTESAAAAAAAADELQPPPAEPAGAAAMSQAVSQAVTQAVSQAVSHAVSQAVSQEMTAPVQGLTDMSDQDLLSYINPSTFDQV